MAPGLRCIVSLGLALAAHALLLLLPLGSRPDRRPPMRVVMLPISSPEKSPDSLVAHGALLTRPAAVEPTVLPPAAPSEPPPHESPPAAPLSPPAAAEETTETPTDTTRPGPRAPEPGIDLFAPAAIARVAAAPDTLERRKERWNEQARAAENVPHGAGTPELVGSASG